LGRIGGWVFFIRHGGIGEGGEKRLRAQKEEGTVVLGKHGAKTSWGKEGTVVLGGTGRPCYNFGTRRLARSCLRARGGHA